MKCIQNEYAYGIYLLLMIQSDELHVGLLAIS